MYSEWVKVELSYESLYIVNLLKKPEYIAWSTGEKATNMNTKYTVMSVSNAQGYKQTCFIGDCRIISI